MNSATADTVMLRVSDATATPWPLKAVAVTRTASGPVDVGPAMNEAIAWPDASVTAELGWMLPLLGSCAEKVTSAPLTGLSVASRTVATSRLVLLVDEPAFAPIEVGSGDSDTFAGVRDT